LPRSVRSPAVSGTKSRLTFNNYLMGKNRALGALLAVGVSLLAACSSNAASTVTHASPTVSTATDGRSALSLAPPSMIGRALAKGTAKPTATPGKTSSAAAAQRSTPPGGTSSQSGSQGVANPSGENPPTALSGFTLKYTQNFDGGSIPPSWDAYSAVPG